MARGPVRLRVAGSTVTATGWPISLARSAGSVGTAARSGVARSRHRIAPASRWARAKNGRVAGVVGFGMGKPPRVRRWDPGGNISGRSAAWISTPPYCDERASFVQSKYAGKVRLVDFALAGTAGSRGGNLIPAVGAVATNKRGCLREDGALPSLFPERISGPC